MTFHFWKIEDLSYECGGMTSFLILDESLTYVYTGILPEEQSATDMGVITEEEIAKLKKFGIIEESDIYTEESKPDDILKKVK